MWRSITKNLVIKQSTRCNISKRRGRYIGCIVKTIAVHESDTRIYCVIDCVVWSPVVAVIITETSIEYDTSVSRTPEETKLQRRSTLVAAEITGSVLAMTLLNQIMELIKLPKR